jgi:hypothetical protein
MHAAAPRPPPGEGDIERLFSKPRGELCFRERGAARFERGFNALFCGVVGRAGRTPLFGVTRRAEARELSRLSEVARLCVLERGRVGCRAEIRKRAFDDGFEGANGLLWL